MLDQRVRRHWRSYLIQVSCATLALVVILVSQDTLANVAIVTALASTAFIVFVNPGGLMAQPRRVTGGHAVAIIVSFFFSVVIHDGVLPSGLDGSLSLDVMAALCVGVMMLIMAVTNLEHAPAAGTAVGLVVEPWHLATAVSVIVAAVIFAAIHTAFHHRMRDLI
jgi:CBS-domain-containing membrane protein